MIYTPVLKKSGDRLYISSPRFSEGFDFSRGMVGDFKGQVTDLDTGKTYDVFGKPCNLGGCECDSYAVEAEEQ